MHLHYALARSVYYNRVQEAALISRSSEQTNTVSLDRRFCRRGIQNAVHYFINSQVNAPRSCRSGILSLLMNGTWSGGKNVA